MKIGLIGQSHMGIVSSVGWASFGYEVVSVDIDADAAASLTAGKFPITEPGLNELYEKNKSRICYTTDFSTLSGCPLVLLVRDTPTGDDNVAHTDVLFDLVGRALPYLAKDVVLVSLSQAPAGFSRKMEEFIKKGAPSIKFHTWVETFIFGDAVKRFLEPERIIIGFPSTGSSAAKDRQFPDVLKTAIDHFRCPVVTMSFESAELTKAAINLYLASSITFANTLADLCEATGANIEEIIPALQLDRRIGKFAYLRPGLGIAGGNIERDLVMLCDVAGKGKEPPFIQSILDYNADRFGWLKSKLDDLLSKNAHPIVCLWGLAYKKNTRVLKHAPSLKVLEALKGKAEIRAYDPEIQEPSPELEGVALFKDKYEALTGADCLLIMTDWDEFKDADVAKIQQAMRSPLVIDSVNILADAVKKVPNSGVQYHPMGMM